MRQVKSEMDDIIHYPLMAKRRLFRQLASQHLDELTLQYFISSTCLSLVCNSVIFRHIHMISAPRFVLPSLL